MAEECSFESFFRLSFLRVLSEGYGCATRRIPDQLTSPRHAGSDASFCADHGS